MDKSLIIYSIAVLIFIGFVVFYFKGKKQNQTLDYRTLFILGIVWIPIGISTNNYLFIAVGVVVMGVGIFHKSKWQEIPGWSKMPIGEKITKIMLISVLVGLSVLGVILYLTQNKEVDEITEIAVTDYDSCVDAGYPVMESYPERCRAKEGDTFTRDIGNELNKVNVIRVDSPRPGAVIESPLVITGQARGTWFFEGDFPIVLVDLDGLIIAEGYATAQGEWMTEEFVPFEGRLEFNVPELYNRGTLILQKDNPSDLPENDDALEVPVEFFIEDITGYEQALHEISQIPKVEISFLYPENLTVDETEKHTWYWLEEFDESCNPKVAKCIESIKILALWYECEKDIVNEQIGKDSHMYSDFYQDNPDLYADKGSISLGGVEGVLSEYSSPTINEVSFIVGKDVCFIGMNDSLAALDRDRVLKSINVQISTNK